MAGGSSSGGSGGSGGGLLCGGSGVGATAFSLPSATECACSMPRLTLNAP
jgi:hypothetical protein